MKNLISNVAFLTGAMLGALWLPINAYYFDGDSPRYYWGFAIPALGVVAGAICAILAEIIIDLVEGK